MPRACSQPSISANPVFSVFSLYPEALLSCYVITLSQHLLPGLLQLPLNWAACFCPCLPHLFPASAKEIFLDHYLGGIPSLLRTCQRLPISLGAYPNIASSSMTLFPISFSLFLLLQPQWHPCCSLNVLRLLSPQDIYFYFPLCLEYSLRYLYGSYLTSLRPLLSCPLLSEGLHEFLSKTFPVSITFCLLLY